MTKNKKVVKDVKKVDIKEKATLMKEIDIIFENKKVDSNNANIDNNQKKSNKIINKKVKKIDNAEDNDSVEDEDDDDDDDDDDDGGMEYFHDDNTHGLIVSNKNKADGVDGTLFKGISPSAPLHRVDRATGLPVYKAALLKAGEGGGTKYCPFDCNCCF